MLVLQTGQLTGRLIVYDPKTGLATTLMSGLFFANGVALAPDDSFVLVAETYWGRIQRYWLKGEKAGTSDVCTCLTVLRVCTDVWLKTTQIFFTNGPAFIDGMSRAAGGKGFWLALYAPFGQTQLLAYKSAFIRKLLMKLPAWVLPKPVCPCFIFTPTTCVLQKPYGFVALLDQNGQVVRALHDAEGSNSLRFVPRLRGDLLTWLVLGVAVDTITSVCEHGTQLFFGGLHNHYVGVLSVEQALAVPASA